MQNVRLPESLLTTDEKDQGLDIRQVWNVVYKHKLAIIGLTVLVTLIAALFVYRQMPIYRATVTLLIDRSPVQFSPVQDPYAVYSDQWLYYQTQYGLIKRRAIGELVVRKLNLDQAPPQVTQDRFTWKDLLPDEWFPAPPEPTPEQRFEWAVGGVVGGIQVYPRRNSQLVDISFEAASPAYAAQLANAVAEAYIEDNLAGRVEMSQAAAGYLTERLVDLKNRWEDSERAVQSYLDAQKLIVAEEGVASLASQEMALASEKLSSARRARLDAQILRDDVRRASDGGNMNEVLPTVLNDDQVVLANRGFQDSKRKVDELSKRYGPKHPKMIAANSELESAETALERQLQLAADAVSRNYQALAATERAAEEELESIKSRVRDIDRKEFELEALQREAEKNRDIYEQFLTQYKSTSAAGDIPNANARIVERALPPGAPVKPNKKRSLSIALVMGLLLSIGLAFVLEHLDNTVKSPEDAESRLGVPVLGILPRLKTESGADLTPLRSFSQDRHSVFAEAVRTVRTGVLLSDLDHEKPILLITSSVPGEGKTTLSMNLSRAIADMKRVLLIDTDMRRPMVGRALGKQQTVRGLSHFISEEAELQDCMHQPDPNVELYVMPAGVVPPNPLEMLSSHRFESALEKLTGSFDHIVIDCAPTLAVSDAMVLSKLATSVVYVVRMDSTPVQAAQAGLKRLHRVGAHIIGAVLNHAEQRSGSYYGRYSSYGGQYYSSYGYVEDAKK